jgi:hypothetical protein
MHFLSMITYRSNPKFEAFASEMVLLETSRVRRSSSDSSDVRDSGGEGGYALVREVRATYSSLVTFIMKKRADG